MKKNSGNRNINLDIIRCVAIFSVISVHFFLNSEFYTIPIEGKKLYLGTTMRTAFMICVPLFLILTGYLMNQKQLSKNYYRGIKKTIIIYLLTTICILIYITFGLKMKMSLIDAVLNIISFQQYSWYVEMYIGLFLLIPFLNLIYNNLLGRREKRILILTLLILTTFPSIFNTFNFSTLDWWRQPSLSIEYYHIIPSWWTSIYPLTYYFIGAYIHEYKDNLNLSLKSNFICLILSIFASGTYCYWRSYKAPFIWGAWSDWGGFENVTNSVLIFIFLLRIKTDTLPLFVKKVIITISEVSFGMYIVSWIFDNYSYPKLISLITIIADRIPYYVVIVPFNFIFSFLLAYGIYFLYNIGHRCVNCLKVSGK